MSQKSNVFHAWFNPWLISTTALLLLAAAYSVPFLQWYSLSTMAKSINSPAATSYAPIVQSMAQPVQPNGKLYPLLNDVNSISKHEPEVHETVVKEQTFKQAFKSEPSEEIIHQKNAHTVQTPSVIPTESSSIAKTPDSLKVLAPPEELASLNDMMNSMIIIEYADEVVVEFDKSVFSETLMTSLLARIMLAPSSLNQFDILNNQMNKAAFLSKQAPVLFPRVRNQADLAVRYPAHAFAYSRYLLKHQKHEVVDGGQVFVQVTIPLQAIPKNARYTGANKTQKLSAEAVKFDFDALPYEAAVSRFSREFSVKRELIYAIMEVESAFNPQAVSKSNALGLMQIKPASAGKDVYRHIDGNNRAPTPQALLNPSENIRVGTAYLALLSDMYFNQIKNPDSREMLVISAYNGGLNTVYKLFGSSEQSAVEKINSLKPSQVYQKLRHQHPSEETRNYIQKVMDAKKRLMNV